MTAPSRFRIPEGSRMLARGRGAEATNTPGPRVPNKRTLEDMRVK